MRPGAVIPRYRPAVVASYPVARWVVCPTRGAFSRGRAGVARQPVEEQRRALGLHRERVEPHLLARRVRPAVQRAQPVEPIDEGLDERDVPGSALARVERPGSNALTLPYPSAWPRLVSKESFRASCR